MKVLLLALLALILGMGLVGSVPSGRGHRSQVYTVAVVRADLVRDRALWVGKAVLVRGIIQGCLPSGTPGSVQACHLRPQDLRDPGVIGSSARLPLVWGSPSAWLVALRRLPVVGKLLPALQTPQWGVVATYRVQIRVAPADICTDQSCYEVLLLNAVP